MHWENVLDRSSSSTFLVTSSLLPQTPESAGSDPCRPSSGRGPHRYRIPFHSPNYAFSFRKHCKHQPPNSQDSKDCAPPSPSPSTHTPWPKPAFSPSGPQENLRANRSCFQCLLLKFPSAGLPCCPIAVCEFWKWALYHDLT